MENSHKILYKFQYPNLQGETTISLLTSVLLKHD